MDNQRVNNDLARAHIQIQQFVKRWPPREGLFRGTIFPELYRPYYVKPPAPDRCQVPGRVRTARYKAEPKRTKGGRRYGSR